MTDNHASHKLTSLILVRLIQLIAWRSRSIAFHFLRFIIVT
jgi:hypothetical protein